MIPQNILTALARGLRGDTDIVRQYIEDHVKELRRRRWTRMLAVREAIDGTTGAKPDRRRAASRFETADESSLVDILGWDRCSTCGSGVPPGEDCWGHELETRT